MDNTSIRLHKIMNDKNLKQNDILNLAKPYCKQFNVKLSKSDLSQFVSGSVLPGTKKLIILSMVLDVSPAWLMGYDVSADKDFPIISDHRELDNEYLYAINRVLENSGYSINYFANQYQIETKDMLIKLSPEEICNLIEEYKTQTVFAVSEIITNKLNDNIVSFGANPDAPARNAAHALEGTTIEENQHDENMMDENVF